MGFSAHPYILTWQKMPFTPRVRAGDGGVQAPTGASVTSFFSAKAAVLSGLGVFALEFDPGTG